MNETYAHEIINNWKYEGELAVYNYENEKDWILSTDIWGNGLFSVVDENNQLVGELSVQFFPPSEVALEDESSDREILWIGFGMKPELTGKGYGPKFVSECAKYAVSHFNYEGKYVGLGVYAFNQRAVKVYKKAGFEVYRENKDEEDGENIKSYWMRKQITTNQTVDF